PSPSSSDSTVLPRPDISASLSRLFVPAAASLRLSSVTATAPPPPWPLLLPPLPRLLATAGEAEASRFAEGAETTPSGVFSLSAGATATAAAAPTAAFDSVAEPFPP
ncbi:unnamed protein product, partial [Ectocarpus fasciculatus]